MGKRQTLEDKGEWLAIANYTLEENRPFALIAGPRLFRLRGRNRTVRDATGMSEWAEYGYVESQSLCLIEPLSSCDKLNRVFYRTFGSRRTSTQAQFHTQIYDGGFDVEESTSTSQFQGRTNYRDGFHDDSRGPILP